MNVDTALQYETSMDPQPASAALTATMREQTVAIYGQILSQQVPALVAQLEVPIEEKQEQQKAAQGMEAPFARAKKAKLELEQAALEAAAEAMVPVGQGQSSSSTGHNPLSGCD